ncbi:polyunsaturated fatty acid 5-lipoxygenase isoform X1 [Hydra vulgaris]|uniref:polyunsaturated fatty acid 5-lipoxygenase isoform X1 n=1 Tax=Hydra vulgaris TaxID=6087 RepID=UPI0002B41F37|nr:polyunsaturated fatty acid 5-lipoxygenase [Hydra vulgaris]
MKLIYFVVLILKTIVALKKESNNIKKEILDEENSYESKICYLPARCPVTLPSLITNDTLDTRCSNARVVDIARARSWYKITDENEPSNSEFPLKNVPFLNQPYQDVLFAAVLNPMESSWLILYQTWTASVMSKAAENIKKTFSKFKFDNIETYHQLKLAFDNVVRSLKAPMYFDKPSLYRETFTDITENELWKSNKIFAQRRLAGSCPFHLRKVTRNEEIGFHESTLLELLNKDYDFDEYIRSASEGSILSLNEAVEQGSLFVLYHESYNDIETIPDVSDKDTSNRRPLIKVTSPITLFVLVERELKVAAIQIDYKPSSPVYTPSSLEDKWLLARAMVEISDQDICDSKVHLGFIHFHSTIFCLTFRRHLSIQHPLYDFFQWHCVGTTSHISLSYHALVANNSMGHRLFAMGHNGFIKLSKQAYEEAYYGQYEFEPHLRKQGLFDLQVDYYPFREDGKIISEELYDFSSSFIDLYYDNDAQVQSDAELQSYANELSITGKLKPDGGKGKVKDFPDTFISKDQLVTFVYRFLWFNVIHSSSNYAASHTFIPVRPTKLYSDPEFVDSYPHNLPSLELAVDITSFAQILDSFRVNRLFDYSDKVVDKKFKHLVYKTYGKLNSCVQKKMETNNAKRKKLGQLTFQYIEPKWLTNSIHV